MRKCGTLQCGFAKNNASWMLLWSNNSSRNYRDIFDGACMGQLNTYVTSSKCHAMPAGLFDSKETNCDDEMPVQMASYRDRSAYIHLPFCKKKCLYCDFPVIAVGQSFHGGLGKTGDRGRDAREEMMAAYIDAVCEEIRIAAAYRDSNHQNLNDEESLEEKKLSQKWIIGRNGREPDGQSSDGAMSRLETVYFGGGTPSLVPAKCIEKILKCLDKYFGIASDAEISIEADPGTFDAESLKAYKNLGIQRVSVGVQAFDDRLLELCGRSHTLYEVYKAIEDVYAANVDSWSLDLISGLPELTVSGWESNLSRALDAGPPHISIYDLQIESGTPFARKYKAGVKPIPSDDDAAVMYSMASQLLATGGFEHYEISNYAKPSHRCKHNSVYWDGYGYHAFGMGAASYVNGRRFSRPKRFNAYMNWVSAHQATLLENRQLLEPNVFPDITANILADEDILTDHIMLQLRKSDGLRLSRIRDCYMHGDIIAQRILNSLDVRLEQGTVSYDKNSDIVKLIDPQGFLLSNDIISDVFAAIDNLQDDYK
eukprot:jgi/Picsp_1/2964/NSC_01188-R1_oxygen-independent coproporphyrinogen iii oxidase